MAMTTSHPSARKAWSNLLQKSIYQTSFFLSSPLIKKVSAGEAVPADAVIVEMDEFTDTANQNKGSGYVVNYDLDGPLFGIPTAGDNVIQGQSRLSLFSDQLQINQDRFSVVNEGKFADGLVPYSFQDRVRERMSNEYWRHYFDERFIAKASGTLGAGTWVTIDATKSTTSARNVNGSVASDGNDLRAPGSTRIIYGNGKAGASTITATDGLSLDVIDLAVLQATRPSKNSTLKRLVPTLIINGRPAYVLMAGYRSLQAMKANTSGRFYDLQKAGAQGGKDIPSWASYKYESFAGVDVYIVPHPNMVTFTNYGSGTNLNAERCLLLGQGALRIAFGRESKEVNSFSWNVRPADEGNQTIITAGTVCGIQKAAYNTTETGTTREDYAIVAIDCYVSAA